MSKKTGNEQKQGNGTATDAKVDIRRNAKGGVLVTREDVKQTFEFFSKNGNVITAQDLRDKLGIFYKNLTSKDFKFLMQNKPEMTEQELYQLLSGNELTDFDPIKEAFMIYAGSDGYTLDINILKQILENLGFNDISDQDLKTLVKSLDSDGDGKINLSDFRKIANGEALTSPFTQRK